MLTIDGSFGEGGGQILRTSLALAVVTRTPFRMINIRASRKKPGLMRQHLTCVRAAARVSSAMVEGDALNSQEIVFEPQAIQSGHFEFAIGTAGSTMLVLQTVLPALMGAKKPSQLVLSGGTHNQMAPSADFLQRAFFPLLRRMGCEAHLELKRYGFYPAGGGLVEVTINPVKRLKTLEMMDAGEPGRIKAEALLSRLSADIGERELKALARKLPIDASNHRIRQIRDSSGPGNVLAVFVEREKLTEVFTGHGVISKRAEVVAKEVIAEVRQYLKTGAAVGPYLADQLMLPMAMAGAGRFSTVHPSLHSRTNIEIIGKFLDVEMKLARLNDDRGRWGFAVGEDIAQTDFAAEAAAVV